MCKFTFDIAFSLSIFFTDNFSLMCSRNLHYKTATVSAVQTKNSSLCLRSERRRHSVISQHLLTSFFRSSSFFVAADDYFPVGTSLLMSVNDVTVCSFVLFDLFVSPFFCVSLSSWVISFTVFGASVTNLNEPPRALATSSIMWVLLHPFWAVITKATRVKGVIMSLALHYWMGDVHVHHCSGPPVSEMTYTVSSGTLNSTIPF